jgi:hypothetical protein
VIAAAKELVTERKINQFRDGSLKRKLGIPSIRKAGFCFGGGFGGSYLGASGNPSVGGEGLDMAVDCSFSVSVLAAREDTDT